ncbi:MAG: hypothetical protein JWQ42_1320 [Edaphobacter sp.]|nr:hypothetical protein [Edaphobacter sp.]
MTLREKNVKGEAGNADRPGIQAESFTIRGLCQHSALNFPRSRVFGS